MVWHIFKKDCRLLWPGVTLAAFAHAVNAASSILLGPPDEPTLLTPAGYAAVLSLIAIPLLAAMAVQQDPFCDARQDWLVRPIQRGDLLGAKILFVLIMLHGPLFLADLIEGLAAGFPPAASARAALLRGLTILCTLSLPAAALASLTRTLGGAVSGALIFSLGVAVIHIPVSQFVAISAPRMPGTGPGWIFVWLSAGIVLPAAAAVLLLSYFRRGTLIAYAPIAGAFIVLCLPPLLPWKAAFGIQRHLSPQPQAARPISLVFDPNAPRQGTEEWVAHRLSESEQFVHVFLPMRVSGLTDEARLVVDNAALRVITVDGSVAYSADTNCYRARANLGSFVGCADRDAATIRGPREHGDVRVVYPIHVPADLYARLKDAPVSVEIDYSLTLLGVSATHTMPANERNARIPELGWCAARPGGSWSFIDLRRISAARTPPCLIADLDRPATGVRNCADINYAPFDAAVFPDALHRIRAHIPVLGPREQEAAAQLILKTYAPLAHFTRTAVARNIHLSEWVLTPTAPRAATAVLKDPLNPDIGRY